MNRRWPRIILALLGLTLPRCVDTSPLDFHPETDAGVRDAGAGDAPLIASCRQCIEGDAEPCRPQFDTCAGVDKCVVVLDCVIDQGCFEFPELADRFNCGSPCLSDHGVLAATDPVVSALAQINVCVVNSCSDACFKQ